MRSVHLTNYYHKDSGGISTSYDHLLHGAEKRNRRVCLIVPSEEASVERIGPNSCIYYVPAGKAFAFDRRYRLIMPWQYMIKPSLIRDIIVAENPDMVEIGDKYSLSIMGPMIRKNYFQKLGRPMLVHLSSERMDDNVAAFISTSAIAQRISRSYIRNYILPAFDFHLANSEYTASEFYEAMNPDVSPTKSTRLIWKYFKAAKLPLNERVFVCTKGADTVGFCEENQSTSSRDEILRKAQVPTNSKLLLYSGRLSPEKNIPLLIDTMRHLRKCEDHDFRLVIAGQGPLASWVSEKNSELDNTIVLLGHVEKGFLAKLYANSDIYVHPNPREPFGISPLEAMASELPVVAPNRGGLLSYASNENAWLVDPDGLSFSKAVLRATTDHQTRRQKVRRALSTVREHSSEKATARLFNLYDLMYARFTSEPSLFPK